MSAEPRSLSPCIGFTWLMTGCAALLSGCQSAPPTTGTLNDIDRRQGRISEQRVFQPSRSEEEIKLAYQAYLNDASVGEKMRINALIRMAELEYQASQQLRSDQPSQTDEMQTAAEVRYQQKLSRTIELLSTSIRDYPEASNNDVLLYQLAKAQAENAQHDASIASLQQLAERYPNSPHYVEAQFRIAEDAFAQQDYAGAEYAYSEVIFAPGNEIFYEKSLFKRGWARFKQRFYQQAVDDFLQAIIEHRFADYETLEAAELEQFNEYFRAIALSFSYLDAMDQMHRYFQQREGFRYTYFSYDKLAELYLGQQRYFDAVNVHEQYIAHFPQADEIPYSRLRIIEIWKNSGFTQKIYPAIEDFYRRYQPDSRYWQNQNENSRVNRAVRRALKEYVVLMATYYHNRYQQAPKPQAFADASRWYQRYLQHYATYARQDRIYFLYAELLHANKRVEQAREYYQLAAYDDQLIVHQDAAYAELSLSLEQLLRADAADPASVESYLQRARRYCQQFIDDKRSHNLALRSAELAYNHQRHALAIELADLLLGVDFRPEFEVISLKADAYFQLEEFAETERQYTRLRTLPGLSRQQKKSIDTKLSLAIYRQGEQATAQGQTEQALHHLARISRQLPRSQYAATGLYDAIALSIRQQRWQPAIELIQRFQKLYPRHRLSADVSKKLSVAYLKADQGVDAAREFEKIAARDKDREIRAAAQWQAAELYQREGQTQAAIRAFKTYIKEFKRPYARRQQGMAAIAELYRDVGDSRNYRDWLQKLINEDKKVLNNARNEQTRLRASNAYLALARLHKQRFESVKLALPLNKSLSLKKTAMQQAVSLYGNASANKLYDVTTEATHSIAAIYHQFSQALLESDRPQGLTTEELDQYEILLEDQAFPFQDKAIEFFEINLSRIRDGHYNDWIANSHRQLIELFPLRYDRQPKRENLYRGMH